MSRIVFVVTYLAAAALVVILVDANTGNGQLEIATMVLWGLSSLLLGWGTGQPLWALLVFLVIFFAVPFGAVDDYVYHEAPLLVVLAFIYGIGSAALIVISAVARMIADRRRRAVV
jgi:MFS family permease